MARTACIPLIFLVFASGLQAQDKDPLLKPGLKASEIKKLNSLAKKWIASELKWDEDPKHRKTRDKERQKFMNELLKKSKRKDVLANMGNLLGMFDLVFPYKKNPTYGVIKKYNEPPHHVLAPKGYDPRRKYRSVLVLPSWNPTKKAWTDPKAYIGAYWQKSAASKDSFIVVPELVKGDDYEKVTEETEQGRTSEKARIRGVLGVFGEVQRSFRLDREKMFLDCGKGTCGFGVRLLTYFPARFAGAILRAPVDLGKMSLGGLNGMPMFLVSTPETKANCDKIKEALPDSKITIVDSDPAKLPAAIDAWMADKVRRLYPRSVSLAPTHDMFHKAFWVEIIACEPIDSIGPKEKLELKVVADRDKNRITVNAENVSEIGLYLNDYIVDLDKEVTIVVNGKEIKGTKFQRSIRTIERYMRRAYDATALYTAYHRIEIPKKAEEEGK